MSNKLGLSIVVPTLNEAENVKLLVERIDKSLLHSKIAYEIIFVDDNSTDNTQANIKKLAKKYPVLLQAKDGERGKAYSLLQGFSSAHYDVICMIDADLQYPPEAILPMYQKIRDHDADMVISEREDHETSKIRQLSSKTFNFIFTRLLFGFNYDSQSGLKVFKKKSVDTLALSPTPWSFDLEFIVRALEHDFKILTHSIPFSQRHSGAAKVKLLEVTYELSKASLSLRTNCSPKKIRHSYQRNVEFAKGASHKLAVGISLVTAFCTVNQGNVSAQAANGVTHASASFEHVLLAGITVSITGILITKRFVRNINE